ncbi:alpha/beta fold hydrolase [bacterium]|nr:alpha/beta fold hydrolase [bacterium]
MRALVVHGMFCTVWHCGRLVEGLRGAGLDARGLELPDRGRPHARLAEHVAFVAGEAEAAAAGGAPVALVGHSLGGLVCLLAAARLGDRLARLALLAPAPPAGLHAVSAANARLFLPLLVGGGLALPAVERYTALFMNRQGAALRRAVTARLVPEPRALIRSVALPWLDRARASRLVGALAPGLGTLVLAGAGDRSTPPGLQRRLAGRLPGARYRCLVTPDHYGFIEGEGSEETLAALVDFLRPGPDQS